MTVVDKDLKVLLHLDNEWVASAQDTVISKIAEKLNLFNFIGRCDFLIGMT